MSLRFSLCLALASLFSVFLSAQFEYLAEEEYSLAAPLIYDLDDGGAVIVSPACRYRPGGGVIIEGCTSFRHLARLNPRGDTLWTSRLPSGSFTSVKSVNLRSDGGLVFFMVQSFGISGCLGGSTGSNYLRITHFSPDGELEAEIRTEACVYSYSNVFRLGENRYAALAYFNDWDEFTQEERTLRKLLIMTDDGEIMEEREVEADTRSGFRLTSDMELERTFIIDSIMYRQRVDTLLNIIETDTSANLSELAGYYQEGRRIVSSLPEDNGKLHLLIRIEDANTPVAYYTRYDENLEIELEREYQGLINPRSLTLRPAGSFYIISDNVDLDERDLQLNHYAADGDLLETIIEPGPGFETLTSISFGLDSLELLMVGDYLSDLFPDSVAKREIFIVRDGIISGLFGAAAPAAGQYRVYPNPTSNFLTVEAVNGRYLPDTRLRLYGITGRKVMEVPALGTVSTGHLRPGMYFYQLTSGERTLQTGRILRW